MQDAPTFTSAAEQAAALRRREVLPKQQHQQVSRLPRQHDCVDSTGHGGLQDSTCGHCCGWACGCAGSRWP